MLEIELYEKFMVQKSYIYDRVRPFKDARAVWIPCSEFVEIFTDGKEIYSDTNYDDKTH